MHELSIMKERFNLLDVIITDMSSENYFKAAGVSLTMLEVANTAQDPWNFALKHSVKCFLATITASFIFTNKYMSFLCLFICLKNTWQALQNTRLLTTALHQGQSY